MEVFANGFKYLTGLISGQQLSKSGQEPVWQPGQVHRGRVTGLLAQNIYQVRVEGLSLAVQCKHPLKLASAITMEVQGFKEGQYMVRLLNKDEAAQHELQYLAQNLAQSNGSNTPEGVRAVLLSLKTGIAMEPRVMAALQLLLTNQGNGVQDNPLTLTGEFAQKLTNILTDANSKLNLSKSSMCNLKSIQQILQQALLKPESDVPALVRNLETLLSAQRPVKSSGEFFFGPLLGLFSELLYEIKERARGEGSIAGLKGLIAQGEAAEKLMTGQQMTQGNLQDSDGQDCMFFYLPREEGGASKNWGQLKIIKEQRKNSIEADNFSLSLLLETCNFGPVLLEIKVRDKNIKASGKITGEQGASIFRDAWPYLQASLEAVGYHLGQCLWRVVPFTAELRPRVSAVPAPGKTITLPALDIKV